MGKRKTILDVLTDRRKEEAVNKIIQYIEEELGEEIGLIGAEELLEIVVEAVAADIYNQGVGDSREVAQSALADLNVNLDVLLK